MGFLVYLDYLGASFAPSPVGSVAEKWGPLTGSEQGWAEDALDGFAGTAVTPADSALVLPQVRAQDAVTAYVLKETTVVGGISGALSPSTPIHSLWESTPTLHSPLTQMSTVSGRQGVPSTTAAALSV